MIKVTETHWAAGRPVELEVWINPDAIERFWEVAPRETQIWFRHGGNSMVVREPPAELATAIMSYDCTIRSQSNV